MTLFAAKAVSAQQVRSSMLFKKELFITHDAKYYGKVIDRLSQNVIKYSFGLSSPFHTGRYHGVPLIKSDAVYEYKVYVKRKDFERAKELL